MSCKVTTEAEQGNMGNTSMMVLVWLPSANCPTREILTYALLDTQSSSTFFLEDVARNVTDKPSTSSPKVSNHVLTVTVGKRSPYQGC